MNNRYFTSLLCITLLALAPACCKKPYSAKATKGTSSDVEDVNTMIELDNAVVDIEDSEEIVITKKSIAKF